MWTFLGCILTSYYVCFPFAYLAIGYPGQWYSIAWMLFALLTSMPIMCILSTWEQNKEK